MKALEFLVDVDEQQKLDIPLPKEWSQRQVHVILLAHEAEDAGEELWMRGLAREWAAELADEREDIYTLEDGEPTHATR